MKIIQEEEWNKGFSIIQCGEWLTVATAIYWKIGYTVEPIKELIKSKDTREE